MRDLKAHVWEIGGSNVFRAGNPQWDQQWDQLVAEMETEGYRPVWPGAEHLYGFAVAVFERKPPTVLEAGDAMANLLSKITQTSRWDSPEVYDVLETWREATAREEKHAEA